MLVPSGAGRVMAKGPALAKAFAGRWRIVEMDTWDSDFLDHVEEAHITFTGASGGKIVFGALRAFWTCAMARVTDRRVLSSPGRPGRQRSRLRTRVGQLGN